jgi:hypothetical protein
VLGGAQGFVVQKAAPEAHPAFEQFTIHVGLSYICVKRTEALGSAGDEKVSSTGPLSPGESSGKGAYPRGRKGLNVDDAEL